MCITELVDKELFGFYMLFTTIFSPYACTIQMLVWSLVIFNLDLENAVLDKNLVIFVYFGHNQ